MTVTVFLILLAALSTISSLIMEGIKVKFLQNKENVSYSVAALIVAIVVGCMGMFLYFYFNQIPITTFHIVFIIVMGLATGLCSMVGYDKVKQMIAEVTGGISTKGE